MRYYFDDRVRLIWLEMFVNSFHLMVRLVQSTNKLRALSQSSVHGENYQSCIKVRILGLILVKDAIVGLNQTAAMLGSIYSGHFVRTLATVSIREIPVAIFEYAKTSDTPSSISPSAQETSPSGGSNHVNSTGALRKKDLEPKLMGPTSDTDLSHLDSHISGWATSSEDPRLRIHFDFSKERAGGGQIFMVTMDALAIAGAHPLNSVAEPFTATGINHVAETRLRVEPSGAPGTVFYWRQLVQALVVLWEQVIFTAGRPRWNILDSMWIRYDDTTIAYVVMTTRLLRAADGRS
ncbi:MAG: hypothetical protein Q9203_007279 [Teloschistes exilis]